MGALEQSFWLMAREITRTLHQLFGFQFSTNAEHFVFRARVTTGATDTIGTNYNQQLQVTNDADFVCTRLNALARRVDTGVVIGISSANTSAAGDFPDAPFDLQIIDGGKDRQLHSNPVDTIAAYGTYGGLPGIWGRPRLFARNTTITLQLTSLKLPTTAWRYELAFIGWKIYDLGALDLTSRSV